MKQYHDMLAFVLENGNERPDRTKTGTLSTFGYKAEFDLSNGFPLLTTKKLHTKSIIHELLWFLSGNTNIKYLKENGVSIWDEWADKDGNLGPVYGKQWTSWFNIDRDNTNQIKEVIKSIKENPYSRSHIVSAWNVSDISRMKIPPCHCLFQFYVRNGYLDCQLYQRSGDLFLGVPFNIASYALLTLMVAQVCDLLPGRFIHTFGDLHLYSNHLNLAKLQLERSYDTYPLPVLVLNPEIDDIFKFTFEDISIIGYQAFPSIKAPIAV